MEEVAVLCGLTYGGDAPIVITGANRPGSAPGADGPANLLDAITLARASAARGLGVVVAFGGDVFGHRPDCRDLRPARPAQEGPPLG